MASPLKKIKLTPNKELCTKTTSLTQETMVTSTPRRCFTRTISSPSISSINSDHATASNISESARSSISRASSFVCEYYGENYDNYFEKHKRPPYKGPIWKIYEPIEDNNLYAKILNSPSNTQFVVAELLITYNSDPDFVIKELIQLCVDVAGFQHFNAKQHYRIGSCQDDSKNIVKKLESYEVIEQQPELEENGRYLLMERSTYFVKYLKMGLYSFLQNLIQSAHKMGVLYDSILLKCFTVFLRNMEESGLKCVRHTGVVFAVKILTAIVLVFNNIVNDPAYEYAIRHNTEIVEELNKRKDILQCSIASLYFIFHRNCLNQDSAVYMMRMECIREAEIWTKYFPKLFVSHFQVINVIIKLITDPSKEVRLLALEACGNIFGMIKVIEFVRPVIEILIKAISQRFYDVNIDVAVKAINIYTYLLEIVPDLVSHEMIAKMKKLVFDEHAPVGQAACNCLLAFFHKNAAKSNHLLLALANILIYEEGDCSKELLVEGFLYSCEQMQNWPLFCKCILSDKISDQERRAISEIFAEAVKQRLKGKPKVNRLMSKNIITPDPSAHQPVAEVLDTINIIILNTNDMLIIINMLEVILQVHNNFLDKNFCREYSDISETILQLFNQYSNENLLKHSAEVLKHLSDIPDFAERGRRFARILHKNHANKLKAFLKEPDKKGQNYALKVAILYKHFNLNDLFSFAELTDPLEDADSKTVSFLLICCKWYLIWDLRKLAENNGGDQQELQKSVVALLSKCRIFSIICFNLFQHSDDKTLILEVFSTVCEFYYLFTKELKHPIQLNTLFKDLEIKIDNPNQGNILVKLLEENVICSKIMPLTERRKHVISYVDIINCGVLPPESFVNIFKYFYLYNKEYGHIIEHSLTELSKYKDSNVIHFIVVYTLISVYEKMLGKHGVVDPRSEEGVQLKLLAKQFATFKHFHDRSNLFKLLCLLIDYAFKDEVNLSFLGITKCFVTLLNNDEDRKKM
ncbi:uncharacterized protein LOC130897361 [Diorhabda carinulata]|uniref:uncharacterized protein LOC130897361 n=1 Tax=Diorhabda carinulata TaxID=1163345 RepID=UPI0025A2815F|nr:uncharacterized protein LOC130897361 [Diorhabda carinulata]